MLGFIRKDLAMIKSNFKILGLLTIVYSLMGLFGEMDISFILPFMSVMIMISTFSYDNYNKWDAYVITLPNGRKNSVKAKYVSTLFTIMIASILTLSLAFVIAYVNTKMINYEQILVSMLGTIFGTILVLSIMYPIIYKFGIEKARIITFVIIFVFFIVGGFLLNFIDVSQIVSVLSFLQKFWFITLIVSSVVIVFLSYKLSLHFNLKREF